MAYGRMYMYSHCWLTPHGWLAHSLAPSVPTPFTHPTPPQSLVDCNLTEAGMRMRMQHALLPCAAFIMQLLRQSRQL